MLLSLLCVLALGLTCLCFVKNALLRLTLLQSSLVCVGSPSLPFVAKVSWGEYLTVSVFSFYVILHCQRPAPILRTQVPRTIEIPGRWSCSAWNIKGTSAAFLTKQDQSYDWGSPQFLLGRQVTKTCLAKITNTVFGFLVERFASGFCACNLLYLSLIVLHLCWLFVFGYMSHNCHLYDLSASAIILLLCLSLLLCVCSCHSQGLNLLLMQIPRLRATTPPTSVCAPLPHSLHLSVIVLTAYL